MLFFKQKTAYEMRISDWSSDVCSSDLAVIGRGLRNGGNGAADDQLRALVPTLHALINQVERQSKRTAVIVERASQHIGTAEFVVDRHVSLACRAVDAQAPFAILSVPADGVDWHPHMMCPGPVYGSNGESRT